MRQILKNSLRAPTKVICIDLEQVTESDTLSVAAYESLWCLVRRAGQPVETVLWDVHAEDVVQIKDLYGTIATIASSESYGPSSDVVPSLTVCICTKDRPQSLVQVLASLCQQHNREFDVLVVDNSSTTTDARAVVNDCTALNIRYTVERRAGLSRARNRGLQECDTEIIVWIDDDELPDPDWIGWLRAGFRHQAKPVAVTGAVLPLELNTEGHIFFEQYGGFNKGRGMTPTLLRNKTVEVRSALYPSPGFGSGGNMAFLRDYLLRDGGFDVALGAGTLTHGGEEAAALGRLLLHGHSVLYWPPALVWHRHRSSMEDVERQLFGYSCGFGAGVLSVLRSEGWKACPEALLALRLGLTDVLYRQRSARSKDVPADYPRQLLASVRRGLLEGWIRYPIQIVKNRIRIEVDL